MDLPAPRDATTADVTGALMALVVAVKALIAAHPTKSLLCAQIDQAETALHRVAEIASEDVLEIFEQTLAELRGR